MANKKQEVDMMIGARIRYEYPMRSPAYGGIWGQIGVRIRQRIKKIP